MNKLAIVLAAIFSFAGAAAGDFLKDENDRRSPIEAYAGDVSAGITICSLKMDIALLKTEKNSYDEAYQCIDDAKRAFKQRYEVAARTVRKPQAKAALKEHLVTAITVVSAIPPANDETKSGYTKRQADLKDKLTEKWSRFEVEN